MPSPDGRPVTFDCDIPWQGSPEVWVDQSGYFVNEDGEPLNEEDLDDRDE